MNILKCIINYIRRPNVVNRAIRINEQAGSIPSYLSEIAKKFYRQFPKNKFFTNFIGNKENIVIGGHNSFGEKTTKFYELASDSKFKKLGSNIRLTKSENGINIRRIIRLRNKPNSTFMSERVVRSGKDGKLLNYSVRNYEIPKKLPLGIEDPEDARKLLSHKFIDYTKPTQQCRI